MALRDDDRQWIIYDPDTVDMAFKATEAAALVMFGAWLQGRAATLPIRLAESVGTIGTIVQNIGVARQQIQAGLAPNDVPDTLVAAQRGWDGFVRYLHDPTSVDLDRVADVIDEIAAALVYLNERTHGTGTNHPRWNSRLVSGTPCPECGR